MKETMDDNNGGGSLYEEWATLGDETEFAGDQERAPETLPSPESKERELTFEHLAELSMEEYIELWKHLNPFYASHITRQGVRDHADMMYHTAGVGDFQNGGKEILRDGKVLRSTAEAVFGLPPDFTEEDVAKVLDEMVPSDSELSRYSPQRILDMLIFNSSFASADPWADKQAVHFGQHTVLNEAYGGESGNEIFFIFPTDVLVSQCKFGGHIHEDLSSAQVDIERQWNDLFVWPEDGRVPLDAGIVFLPESQMVDRKTGSKYATKEIVDESGNTVLVPEKDKERMERFMDWLGGLSEDSPEIRAIAEENDYSLIETKLKEIGIPEDCFDGMVRYQHYRSLLLLAEKGHFGNLGEEQMANMPKEEIMRRSVGEYLSSHNADLKLSDDVVSAKEYWEQYFSDNPEQRPAHVVYYNGDPSTAVKEFLIENGIAREKTVYSWDQKERKKMTGPGDTVDRDGKMLGFDAHYIGDGDKDEHLVQEHKRFNEMALKILKKRFGDMPDSGYGFDDLYGEDLEGWF